MVEIPKRKQQMYKCHEPQESCGPVNPILHRQNVHYGCNCRACTRTSHRGDMPVSLCRLLALCLTAPDKWIAVWVSFPRFRVSGIVFTSTKSTCFCQKTTYQTRVVHSEVALWLTRMSELSQFVYVGNHVTLSVTGCRQNVGQAMAYPVAYSMAYRWSDF